ncbi:MAG: hypothetical protein WCJ69_14285 [Betaproteobacteria bacterium]
MKSIAQGLVPALMFAAGLTPVAAGAASVIDSPIFATRLLTTRADPSNDGVDGVNEQLSGAAGISISSAAGATGGCSGALTGNGGFVLAAAHCVADGSPGITATSVLIQSSSAQRSPSIPMSAAALPGNIFLPTGPDGWTGDFKDGLDLASIEPVREAETHVLVAMGLLGVLISVGRRGGGGWGSRVARLA